jgi:hypothetical protein
LLIGSLIKKKLTKKKKKKKKKPMKVQISTKCCIHQTSSLKQLD